MAQLNFDTVDPKSAPHEVKWLLTCLAAHGWDCKADGGFSLKVGNVGDAANVLRVALDVFQADTVAWEFPVLTFKGPTAAAFLRLYHRVVRT